MLPEFLVAFSAGKQDIDPYSHRLWRRRSEVVLAVVSLYAESRLRAAVALRRRAVRWLINKDVLDRLEVDAPARLRLRPVGVVGKRALGAIENEPAPAPSPEPAAHLREEAAAGGRRHLDIRRRRVNAVSRRLNELTEVEAAVAYGEVPRHRTSLTVTTS